MLCRLPQHSPVTQSYVQTHSFSHTILHHGPFSAWKNSVWPTSTARKARREAWRHPGPEASWSRGCLRIPFCKDPSTHSVDAEGLWNGTLSSARGPQCWRPVQSVQMGWSTFSGGPQACTAEGQAAEETWGSRMALKSEVFSAPGRQPIRGQTLTVELKLRGSQGQGSPLWPDSTRLRGPFSIS